MDREQFIKELADRMAKADPNSDVDYSTAQLIALGWRDRQRNEAEVLRDMPIQRDPVVVVVGYIEKDHDYNKLMQLVNSAGSESFVQNMCPPMRIVLSEQFVRMQRERILKMSQDEGMQTFANTITLN